MENTRSLPMHGLGLSRNSRDTDRNWDTEKRCRIALGSHAITNVLIEEERAPHLEARACRVEKTGHLVAVTGEKGRERARERGGRNSARSSRVSTPSKPSLISIQSQKEKRGIDREKEGKTDEEKDKEKEPCKLKDREREREREREKRGITFDPMTTRRRFWSAAVVAVAVRERLIRTVAEKWGRKKEARKQLRAGWLILRACLRFRGKRYSVLQVQLMKRHRAAVRRLIQMVREKSDLPCCDLLCSVVLRCAVPCCCTV